MIIENLDKMIADAIKNGKHTELNVWRAIKTAFTNYQTAKAGNIITNDIEIQIISKMIAQHNDSIMQYKQGNRLDLVECEEKELSILKSLMPKEPTEKEIETAVIDAIKTVKSTKSIDYILSMKDMKDIMSIVKTKYPTVNGGIISKIYKNNI